MTREPAWRGYTAPMRFRFDVFVLDTASGELLRDGQPVPLRRQTFRLLQVLVERAPDLLDRDTLLDEVWGRHALSPNVLPQAISELRQSLGDSAQAPRFIETRHRRGYRFCAPVSAEDPPGLATPAAASQTPAAPAVTGVPAATPGAGEPGGSRDPLPRLAHAARWRVAAAALLLLGGALFLLTRPDAERVAAPSAPPPVVALGPLSPAPGVPDWVAAAGLELFSAALARQPRLQLLRSDALGRDEGSADLRWQQRMHALLGAPLAIGGAWRAEGEGRIGLELSLIDLASGRILLAHRDGAAIEDLDLLVTRASTALLAALRLPQAERATAERPPAQVRLRYWQALQALAQGQAERAVDGLEALRSTPGAADWLMPSLARAYREAGRRDRAAAVLAERLGADHTLPLGLRLRLQAEQALLTHRPDAAAAALLALVELFPEDLEAQLQLAEAQLDALQGAAARSTLGRLGEQPRARRDPRLLLLQARAERLDGRYAEAHERAQEALDSAMHHGLHGLAAAAVLSRSETHKRAGDLGAAERALQAFLAEFGDQLEALPRDRLRLQALALLREQGRHEAAFEMVSQLAAAGLPEALRPWLAVEAALLEVLAGRAEQAEAWLHGVAESAEAIEDPALAVAWRNADALRVLAAGDVDGASAAFDAAFAEARRSGLAGQTVALQVNAGLSLARQRRFEEAEALWTEALTVFERLGDRRGQATCLGNLAAAASASGRGERAEALNRQALALFRELSLTGPLARTAYNLGLGERRRGELAAAEALFAEALQGWLAEGQADLALQAAVQRAELLLIGGDAAAAEAQLQAVQAQREAAAPLARSHWLAAAARHALALGQLETARDLEAAALALRRESGHAGWMALSELELLRLDLLGGADPLPLQLAAEALVARFEQLGDRRDLARARLAQAEMLLSLGRRAEAMGRVDAARAAAAEFADLELALQLDWVHAWASAGAERSLRLQALQQRAEAAGYRQQAALAQRSLALAEAHRQRSAPAGAQGGAPTGPPLPPYARWTERASPAGAGEAAGQRISP